MNNIYPALIIAIEGMDCSFKETNSKKLKEYLEQKYPNKKVYLYAFPNYESESSYFVRQWLNRSYSEQFKNISDFELGTTISLLYTLDRLDTFKVKDIWTKLQDKDSIIIFDRYIMSNIYYQTCNISPDDPLYGLLTNIILKNEIKTLQLPIEDITIFMRSPLNLILEKINDKSIKDCNEKDINFLTKVYNNINNSLNFIRDKKSILTNLRDLDNIYDIWTSDDNNTFLSEDELFSKVINTVEPAINKYFKEEK